MSAKKHHVTLSAEQRSQVEKMARSNQASIRERARILLAVDEAQPGGGQKDADAARTAGSCAVTVGYVRARFAEGGLEAALHHREQVRRKLDRRFPTADARIKLRRLYPVILPCRSTRRTGSWMPCRIMIFFTGSTVGKHHPRTTLNQ